MTQVTSHPSTPLTGVGLGLRWAFLEDALTAALPDQLVFFELSPENYMRRGGYYPQALHRVQARRPLRSHGLMLNVGGRDPLDRGYLRQLRDFLDEMGIGAHSDHLCWQRSRGRYLHEHLPLEFTAAEARRIGARAREVADILQRPLALENVSYYAELGGPADPHREAEFVHRVCEAGDCRLLLDVNNAAVNGSNFGFDPWEFIRQLPFDRIDSLHVGGGERLAHFGDRLIDTHGSSVNAEVLELMRRTLQLTGPLPVLYERDNELPSFELLCQEVVELSAVYTEAIATPVEPPAPERIELPASGAFDPDEMADYFLSETGDHPPETCNSDQAALYRRLVRGALVSPLESFLERSAARLGTPFQEFERKWLEFGGSRSPFLRDLPQEFVSWLSHPDAGDLEAWRIELMRHELVHYRVSGAVTPPLVPEATLAVNAPLHPALPYEVLHYEHAVHELPAALDDSSVPEERPVKLLVYRDPEHRVRYLELSSFGAKLVEGLLDGLTLEEALRDLLQAFDVPLADEDLARAGKVLAQLTERGLFQGVG